MRQIEEFSENFRQMMTICMAWTAGLVAWIWICVTLHFRDVDMSVAYTVVAVAIGIQILRSVIHLSQEESRTARKYKDYLDTYSYQVLNRMRNDPDMSSWSKREISKYLKSTMIWGY